jgi:hypothetical protein
MPLFETPKMELNEVQKNILKNLREILNYGNSKLSSTYMDYRKLRFKKQILFLMMGAVQSYSEAILKLLDPEPTYNKPSPIYDKAAEVLFRSLSETLINLNYIYGDRTQTKAAIFLIHSLEDRIDFAEKFKHLKEKHKNWNLVFGDIKTPEEWESFISKRNDELKFIEKRLNKKLKDRFPDLRPRAEQADSYLKKKGKLTERKSLEVNYVYYYKYFSQLAHLTMPGLESFFSTDDQGNEMYSLDGNGDDIERVAEITYVAYFVILKFFMQEYKIYNSSEFMKFKKIVRDIGKPVN